MDYEKEYKSAKMRCEWQLANGLISEKCATDLFRDIKESEDERIRKELISLVEKGGCITSKKDRELALAYLEKQKEQKPTNSEKPKEWSEEDERMLNNCVSALKEGANGHAIVIDYGEHERWLNSLSERFKNQPKREWSEEDKNFIKELSNLLASIAKNNYVGRYYAPDLVSKLQSL